MNKLLYPANENGTYVIPVTFRDRDNSIVSDARVASVNVSLQNREGDYIVDRPVAAVGVQSVSLSGNDLRIEDQTKDQELRIFTVDAVVDSRPVHMEWEMFVKNLSAFSDVGSNVQWRDESYNPVGIYSSLAAPAFDYGYVCNGGVLVKATSSESTSSTPTNPTFVSQCNDGVTAWPPTSFAELAGMPGSDDFDGVGCNSGDVDDINRLIRWFETINGGSIVYASNKLTMTSGSGPFTHTWQRAFYAYQHSESYCSPWR